MVEAIKSFKCSPRVYFLAVELFDQYLRKSYSVAKKSLNNDHVHSAGLGCMFLASKYEDIFPMHSRTIAEKIAHGAFTRHEVLKKEEELLLLFDFDLSLITPYDIW